MGLQPVRLVMVERAVLVVNTIFPELLFTIPAAAVVVAVQIAPVAILVATVVLVVVAVVVFT
jgi:hypothetical protein